MEKNKKIKITNRRPPLSNITTSHFADMADVLTKFLISTLPNELAESLAVLLHHLENAEFQSILENELVRKLLGHLEDESLNEIPFDPSRCWSDFVFDRIEILLRKRQETETSKSEDSPLYLQHFVFITGLASLGAFLQSNAAGPPLPFSSPNVLLVEKVAFDPKALAGVRQTMIKSLGADGEAAYKLTPNIELFCLADAIMTCPPILKNIPAARWAKVRVNFLHQRLLSGIAPSLEKSIYEDLDVVSKSILDEASKPQQKDTLVSFLLERATVHTHHGFDKLARADLDQATNERGFEFALTGLLGKRTKFQQKDVSQLVVLARSAESDEISSGSGVDAGAQQSGHSVGGEQPKAINLDDDTLLESISFSEQPKTSVDPQEINALSPQLASLDPEHQPILHPLDSVILLSLAASITNTSPAHGLTREETMPYATRVLEGGSSNWQVYTQALLLRSRIEGYKSRTVERGLLQLQALVDQVIADTTSNAGELTTTAPAASTFLPKGDASDAAPASQRLLYIYQLCSPTRWELEAELAARWVNLGGLRSALEIYERLEMWPEVALCWAATERDDKARKIVRKQLFHAVDSDENVVDEDLEQWTGAERDPAPLDAPRLYCILADIDKNVDFYEKAWEVSNQRYARAQRSLGKHYYGLQDYAKASLSFSKALKVKQLDHATWFALGCALLELGEFRRAVEAFTRAVQLDDTDAEAWSNLAAALLNLKPEDTTAPQQQLQTTDQSDSDSDLVAPRAPNPQKHTLDALHALKRASKIKYGNHRIWENLLTVAASLSPPSWTDMLTAQRRVIELRGFIDGEKCIDVKIMSALVNHAINEEDDWTKPGLPRMLLQLFDKHIVPLITASAPLWHLVAKLSLHRKKPSAALDANEKAWRAVISQPGWEHGTEAQWDRVVDATIDLVSAYESLGPRERTEGLGAGEGELVMKEWRFKGRSAVRGIMGRGKGAWEETAGWERLVESLAGLKGS
jgi:tetratricopeptide (TPR) repeat protein